MKNMKYTICFIFVILSFSCGIENHDISSNEIENILKRTAIYTEFETKMQWASYLAAMVLEINEEARNEFSGLINGQNKTISVKDIFSDQTIASSIAPAFRDQFIIFLSYYSLFVCEPGKPENVPKPPSTSQDPTCIQYFLDYIIKDNCIEFYFPNELDLSPVLPISTTAHPLTQADNNYGFLRYEKFPGITSVMEKDIDPTYLINKDIIVARPVDGGECDYSDLGINDFTLFLSN